MCLVCFRSKIFCIGLQEAHASSGLNQTYAFCPWEDFLHTFLTSLKVIASRNTHASGWCRKTENRQPPGPTAELPHIPPTPRPSYSMVCNQSANNWRGLNSLAPNNRQREYKHFIATVYPKGDLQSPIPEIYGMTSWDFIHCISHLWASI